MQAASRPPPPPHTHTLLLLFPPIRVPAFFSPPPPLPSPPPPLWLHCLMPHHRRRPTAPRPQAPLLFVFVLHLSGGGHVMWLLLHHATADFTSLQALAGAVSEAYQQLMQSRDREQQQRQTQRMQQDQQQQQQQQQRGRAASLSVEVTAGRAMPEAVAATTAEGEALGPSLRQGQGKAHARPPRFAMCAADVEVHADASPYPPGVPERDDFIAADWLALVRVVWSALYRMLFLGGGVQVGGGGRTGRTRNWVQSRTHGCRLLWKPFAG